MKKTAVVYDKWLSALGGGEVVSCTMAAILKEQGYDVTMVSGTNVDTELIKEKLAIDLQGINFIQLWNDEQAMRELTKNKDLFINISFWDYTKGYAKKNIYYVHFPTKPYGLKGKIINDYLLPFLAKVLKPIEKMEDIYAISLLQRNHIYTIKAILTLRTFYKNYLENISINIRNAHEIQRKVSVHHSTNTIHIQLSFRALSSAAFITIQNDNDDKDNLKSYVSNIPTIPTNIYRKINERLRAGVFPNIQQRIDTYDVLITHSQYVAGWVEKYWNKKSVVIYPPVSLLTPAKNKEKWICSVGRFFQKGHGKKQEVMIEAFKKFFNKGNKNWQLHLIGGVGNEYSSQEFLRNLQKAATGYPIYFHINAKRNEMENIVQKSTIYWHAAGYGETKPVNFEHFGIAPVEAISAGCIPLLYNGGGLPEIIDLLKLPKEQHLYNSVEGLKEKTIQIIKNTIQVDIDHSLLNNFTTDTFKTIFTRQIKNLS